MTGGLWAWGVAEGRPSPIRLPVPTGTTGSDTDRGLREALVSPPGFVILEGFDVSDGPEAVARRVASLLEAFAVPIAQDGFGSVWHEIQAKPRSESGVRASEIAYPTTTETFEYHTDAAFRPVGHEVDLMALVCCERAAIGGETWLMSGETLKHWLTTTAKPLADRLCRDVPFAAAGAAGLRDRERVVFAPVFAHSTTGCAVRLHRWRTLAALDVFPSSVDSELLEALAALDDVFAESEFGIELALRPGDLLLVNNRRLLHARNSYQDGSMRRRTLVRMWFMMRRLPESGCEAVCRKRQEW